MRFLMFAVLLAPSALSQQIMDVFETTWDKSKLFSGSNPSNPINFTDNAPVKSANIIVDDKSKFQTIAGFGSSLTDSAATTLSNLKKKNSGNYRNLIQTLFSPAYGGGSAGLNYIRVPIGASDFSAKSYSLADTAGDTSFSQFDLGRVPAEVFSVLKDIKDINPYMKVHLVPWSPPGWMKTTNSMNGGSLKSEYISAYPTYLLKAVQGFKSKGLPVYALSTQNEPHNSNPSYPTCAMTADVETQIASSLRKLLDSNDLSDVKLIGYEHNWDDAQGYPVRLIKNSKKVFDGVAFHCYEGDVSAQDQFHKADPNTPIYLTECTGTLGSDWWGDVKWFTSTLWIGALKRNSETGMMWNIALDESAGPKFPGTNSCSSGCRPLVTVKGDGSYVLNQEFYSMAQASKAVIPQDASGPYGKRIGVSVADGAKWAFTVGAYETARTDSKDWNRYSVVVLNWNDGDKKPIDATIEFRGKKAAYTFPVGVTTLWWFAPPS